MSYTRDFWEGAYFFLSKYYDQLYKEVSENDEVLENELIL